MDGGCGIFAAMEVFDDDKLDRIVEFNSAIMMIAKSTNINRYGWLCRRMKLKACRPEISTFCRQDLTLVKRGASHALKLPFKFLGKPAEPHAR